MTIVFLFIISQMRNVSNFLAESHAAFVAAFLHPHPQTPHFPQFLSFSLLERCHLDVNASKLLFFRFINSVISFPIIPVTLHEAIPSFLFSEI